MKKNGLMIFLMLVCLPNLLAQEKLNAKEYNVYATVLKAIYKDNRETYTGKSEFVIIDQTNVDPELELPKGRKYRDLVKDFVRKNVSVGIIERKFPAGAYSKTYQLVTQAEIDKINEKARAEYERRFAVEKLDPSNARPGGFSWTIFYQAFPDASGYFQLSRVGFSGKLAMVQVTGDLGWSGFSRTYILKRTKGKWHILSFIGSNWID